jgi:hypothetical protein
MLARCTWLTTLGLAVPLFLHAADSETKKETSPKEKLIPAGTLMGKITAVSENGSSITLRVYGKVAQPNLANPYQGCGS